MPYYIQGGAITDFFTWWYSDGLTEAWDTLVAKLFAVVDFFSVDMLIKTWLAPWKGDVQSARNIALQDQVKLWESNLASRAIGFIIRSFVILLSLIIIAAVALVGALALVAWVIMPALLIGLPIIGLTAL